MIPGDGLLRPVPLLGIALLLLNDHVLKLVAPGDITGKLSDFAGLTFFPLLLVALWEVGIAVVGRMRMASEVALVAAIFATGIGFAAIEIVPAAADVYRAGLGFVQWVLSTPFNWLFGLGSSAPARVSTTQDPTDLVALAALAVAYVDGLARLRASRWT
ncbi:MAG: hypothetical protein WD830_02475 [Chloroflexota bacterium]